MFHDCTKGIKFEDIATGRKGAVLVKITNGEIPIVRTTSVYKNPVQEFSDIHHGIIEKIKELIPGSDFNNALVEIYDPRYKSMAFHSDQALDIHDESYICIYSCYENDTNFGLRKIITKKKNEENDEEEIVLKNNSFHIFSTDTNRKYMHKIILDDFTEENRWLGITFRLSKTFVKFIDNVPHIHVGVGDDYVELTHSTPEEKKMYYKCRSLENKNTDYQYPPISFSISPSDFINLEVASYSLPCLD